MTAATPETPPAGGQAGPRVAASPPRATPDGVPAGPRAAVPLPRVTSDGVPAGPHVAVPLPRATSDGVSAGPRGARPRATPSTAARRTEAARAHRTETADRRRRVATGPQSGVATVLDTARLAGVDELSADLHRLAGRIRTRIEQARPSELAGIPAELTDGLSDAGRRLDRTVTARTAPALRRLAAGLCPGAAPLPVPVPDRSVADVLRNSAAPPPAARSVLSDPRLVGTVAGLPVLAVHGIGVGPALVAVGAVVLAGALGRARAVTAERARLADHVTRSVAAAGVAGEREVRRRLTGTRAAVGATLERAVRDAAR